MIADRRRFLSFASVGVIGAALLGSCGSSDAEAAEHFPVQMSEDAWRKKLGPDAFAILRKARTERPYSSPLNDEHRAGIFACKGCDQHLYSSKTKFDSHTGWPSFCSRNWELPRYRSAQASVASFPNARSFPAVGTRHCEQWQLPELLPLN